MEKIVIASAAMTKFTDHYEKDIRNLASEAIIDVLKSLNLSPTDIDSLVVGSMASQLFTRQGNLGALIAQENYMYNASAFSVEAGEASGQAAVRTAYSLVKSGLHDYSVVVGVEKVTDVLKLPKLQSIVGYVNMDSRYETDIGLTLASLYAMMAKAHMKKFGTTREQIASVAVKNHFHGSLNPMAQYRNKLSVEKVLSAETVAEPLTLFDTCAAADGAAALLITTESKAKELTDEYVEIKATALSHSPVRLADRENLFTIPSIRLAAEKAYQMAGITPDKVDIAEVHDSYTISEIIALEELGLVKRGEAGKATEEKRTYYNGEMPVNTSGGMKARGYPFGAAGVAQIVELYLQLLGKAEKRQVNDAQIGLAQSIAGTGATSIVHVLSSI